MTIPPGSTTPTPGQGRAGGWSEALKLIGGLVAVMLGLLALVLIALVAIGSVSNDSESVVAIASSAFGVIGTLIGAYFGLKVGSDGTQKAIDGLKDEAAKAQAFAVHVPEAAKRDAIADAQALVAGRAEETGGASGA